MSWHEIGIAIGVLVIVVGGLRAVVWLEKQSEVVDAEWIGMLEEEVAHPGRRGIDDAEKLLDRYAAPVLVRLEPTAFYGLPKKRIPCRGLCAGGRHKSKVPDGATLLTKDEAKIWEVLKS